MGNYGNYYQQYFQGKYGISCPGETGKRFYKGNYIPSDKQIAFHKELYEFLENKGANVSIFRAYKTRRDCATKINGLITTLKKNGYAEEFFSNRGETA